MSSNVLRNWIKSMGERLLSSGSRRSRRQRSGAAKRRATTKPVLEPLEDRLTPSTWTVNSLDGGAASGTGSSGNIAYCVASADGGDTIQFSVTGTITLSTLLTVSSNVTITGPGASSLAINSANAYESFLVNSGVTASISGLTLEDGRYDTPYSFPPTPGGSSGGGGIENNGTLTLSNVTLTADTVGLYNTGTAILTNDIISGNTSSATNTAETGHGAGILNHTGSMMLTDVVISNNTDGFSGGGIYVRTGTLNLSNCTLSGNKSEYSGAIGNAGTTTLTNCTVSGNTATAASGGIYNGNSLTLIDCTVSGNSAAGTGGGISAYAGTTSLSNCIVAGNTSSTGPDVCHKTGTVTAAYSLIGNNASSTITTSGNNIVNPASAGLGSLGNYGGPTQTVALLGTSPAIGTGEIVGGVTADQRGISRGSSPDIGAFELETITSSTATLPSDATGMNIYGNGFDTNAANDTVMFNNGVTGTVTSATSTSLFVSVSGLSSITPGTPLTAVLTVDGAASGSPVEVAIVGVAGPVVTSSTASLPTNSSTLTINGLAFDSNAGNDSVSFSNGVTGTVTSATSVSMTVSLTGLTGVTSGTDLTSIVTVDGVTSGSPVQVATVIAIVPTVTSSTASLTENATSLTIFGSDFDVNTANDTVTLNNGVTDSVTSATTTSLTLSLTGLSTVAAGTALTAVATVDTVTSGSPVQVATVAPVVTSSTTSIADSSTTITVDGAGFSTTAASDSVTFNLGVVGTVTTASATQLTVAVTTPPTLLGSLTAVVTINSASSGAAVQVANEINGTWTVTDASGGAGSMSDLTLPYAVGHYVNGDQIAFASSLSGQTVTLSSVLTLSRNVTITGLGASSLSVSGNNAVQVFSVSSGQTVTITSLTVENGKITGSGAGIKTAGTLTLSNDTVSGNSASADGGGIYSSGALTLSNDTFSGNTAAVSGGGIFNFTGGTTTLSNSTVAGNQAGFGGGAVARGAMTVTNATIANNSAVGANGHPGSSGGIEDYGGTLSLTSCTVSGNTATGTGGGLSAYSGATTLSDCIVAGNTATKGPDAYVASGTLTATYSLIGNNSGSGITATGNNIVNPSFTGLSTLGNYGGPTQTIALLPGSPAIDAGNNAAAPTTDQRGEPRPGYGSTVDIGAFESQGFTIAIVSGNNQSSNTNAAFSNPLVVSVTPINAGEPVNGGQVTFTVNPVSGAGATLATSPATISGGDASVAPTANGTAGSYTVTASASGAASVTFNLTNLATAPTVISSSAGLPITSTSITIAGSGFDTNAGNDTVTFDNGVTGTVASATSSTLTVSLTGLSGVASGTALHASVTTDSLTSGSAVEVAIVAPVITSSTASLFTTATTMTIAGFGFDTTASHDTVNFTNAGVSGTVSSATSTSLTVSLTGLTSVTDGTALDASVTVDGESNGSAVQVATVNTPVFSVTAVSPSQGPVAGGTTIVITGADFVSVAAVTIGGTAASTYAVNSTTQITAVDAAGTGEVNITVTVTSHGSQTTPTSSADEFTYVAPPVANGQSISTNENTAESATLTASESDSNPLTYAIATSPGHGTLTSFNASSGVFTYTPAFGYYGADSFTFTASDGVSNSTAATVSITVVDNVTPTANGQSVSTNENTAYGGTVTGSDADSNPLTYAVVTSPTNGSLTSFNASTGIFTYTPTTGFHGSDSFTFDATDGHNTSSAATISITVVPTASAPTVTGLSPTSGLVEGGTSVVITGTNFTGATAVDFGSTAATTFSVNGAGTQITAVDHAGSGTVDVTVATSSGTSATSSADHFTYAAVASAKLNGDVAPIVDMSSAGSSTVLVTTDGNNGFTAGDTVVISEFTGANSGYNGTYTIVTASGDTFKVHNANSATLPSLSSNTQGFAVSQNTSSGLIGSQRSMVDSVAYTFSAPVAGLTTANFSLTAAASAIGLTTSGSATAASTVPGMTLTSLSGGSIWVVSWNPASPSVVGHSIADGLYEITLANSERATDTFYRLFGNVVGYSASSAKVNSSDTLQFSHTYLQYSGSPTYNAACDYDANGVVNSSDTLNVSHRYLSVWGNFAPTI